MKGNFVSFLLNSLLRIIMIEHSWSADVDDEETAVDHDGAKRVKKH